MLNLIRKDFMSVSTSKWGLVAYFIGIPFVILLLRNEDGISTYVMGMFAVIIINILSKEELKGNLNILMASLPVKKHQIVISRYISSYLLFFISSGYVILMMYILGKLGIYSNLQQISNDAIKFIMGVAIIALSISIPISLFSNMDLGTSFFIVAWCLNRAEAYISDNGESSFGLSKSGNSILLIIVFIAFTFSIALSLMEYKNREF